MFVNNLVYDRGTMDLDGQSDYDRVTKSSLVGNVFLRGPSYSRDDAAHLPAYQRAAHAGARIAACT